MDDSLMDAELGPLEWDSQLDGWGGALQLESQDPFGLFVFAREGDERKITEEARQAIRRIRGLELECRSYAAHQLLAICNSEWNDGQDLTDIDFARRLIPAEVEVHESGYVELHFDDGGLFCGHGVGVRLRADGSYQEAVVEG